MHVRTPSSDGQSFRLLCRGVFWYYTLMFKKTLCALLMLATMAPAWAAEWMTDLEAAKAKAAAENKAVLIDFTGSDWCGWCIRLRKQVLDTPAFETYAKDKFVLLEVDLPQNPKFDAKLRARNEEICTQYGVSGFPTILVITPQGELAGGFSGFRQSVDAAAKPLDAALATAALLKQAETQQGAELLATLVQAYKSLPEELQGNAVALRDRIVALDPQDTTGIGRLARVEAQRKALSEQLQAAATPEAAMAGVDKALETAEPENKPAMLQVKFQILLMSARTVDEVKAAAAVGRQSFELNPKATPQDIQRFEASFAKPEQVLERLNKIRAQQKGTPKK